MSDLTDNDTHDLQQLEESLWLAETRFNRSTMDDLFADDFYEVGRSGTLWSREQLLSFENGTIDAQIPLPDFAVRYLSDNIALVTYRSVVKNGSETTTTHRSSIWSRNNNHWQLRYHQGTPCAVSS